MTGNIIGEEFDDFVRDQINIRQSNQFGGYKDILRTPEQLQYLNNRNAWVKLASSVSVLVDTITGVTLEDFISSKLKKINIPNPENYLGTQLAEKAVLFNSLSSYIPSSGSFGDFRAGISNDSSLWNNSAYGLGGVNYGLQPPPGIINVQVDSLNRGSIRKANITLKAHNKFQFDIIELLYLRLGFTMMLEWGWGKYLDNMGQLQDVRNTIIEDRWFKDSNTSQLDMLKIIEEMKLAYAGNYDGFFGKVSNFTWNFNPDGSYDISIDLITLGDVIESLKVNLSSDSSFREIKSSPEIQETQTVNLPGINDTKFKNLLETPIIKAATLNSLGFFLYEKIRNFPENSNYFTFKNIQSLKDTSITLGGEGFNVRGVASKVSYITSISDQYSYYIRLGELLSQLEIFVIPTVNNGSTSTLQLQIEKDIENNLISYFPNQISLDPRVCIFKPSLNTYGDITGIRNDLDLLSLEDYIQTEDTNNYQYGKLMNIYINFNFISELLLSNGGPDQTLSLYKFLQDLCNNINNSLGGVNKLEPVVKDDYLITIIDQTFSKINIKPKDITTLEIYGYNPNNSTSNFVKDIRFQSKITPQLASMISIGATAAGSSTRTTDGTAFSKWSEGLQDRFTQKITDPPGYTQYQTEKTKQETENQRDKLTKKFFTFLEPLDKSTGAGGRGGGSGRPPIKGTPTLRVINYPGLKQGTIMTLEEFIPAAIEADKIRISKGEYFEDELKELTDSNFAAYLIFAFGGVSNKVSILDKNNKSRPLVVPSLPQTRYLEFDDTFISQGKYAYKNYINILNNERFQEEKTPSSEIGFIPLSFDLTLDGISGIKIYNKLNINNEFLPSNYPESLKFIITKVNHTISNNSWDTSLSTISIPVTKPYKFNISLNQSISPTSSTVESLTPIKELKGQLQPLKNIIGAYESNNKYDIANINSSGIRSNTRILNLSFRELEKFQKLSLNDGNRVFGAGKYQITPPIMSKAKTVLNLGPNDLFSEEIQEKMADYILLGERKELGKYLKGANSGNIFELEQAIQELGQEFASMPIIYNKQKQKIGNVETGQGQNAYYGGEGANPYKSKISIKEITRILVQTRINYSSKVPIFIPAYYTS